MSGWVEGEGSDWIFLKGFPFCACPSRKGILKLQRSRVGGGPVSALAEVGRAKPWVVQSRTLRAEPTLRTRFSPYNSERPQWSSGWILEKVSRTSKTQPTTRTHSQHHTIPRHAPNQDKTDFCLYVSPNASLTRIKFNLLPTSTPGLREGTSILEWSTSVNCLTSIANAERTQNDFWRSNSCN